MEKCDTFIVHSLLRHGATVNDMDLFGDTPLHVAAKHGHKEIIEMLIDSGGDRTIKNLKGETPGIPLRDCLKHRGG